MMLNYRFFLRYNLMTSKRNKTRQLIVLFLCSLAVALSSLGTNFLSEFKSAQEKSYSSLSAQEIFVINKTIPRDDNSIYTMYNPSYASFTSEEISKICELSGIDSTFPFIQFSSSPYYGFAADERVGEDAAPFYKSIISWTLNEEVQQKIEFNELDEGGDYYTVIPYRNNNIMRQQCDTWNEESKGAYITSRLADKLGIDSSVQTIILNVEVWIPIIRFEAPLIMGTPEGDRLEFTSDSSVYVKRELEVPLNGILRSVEEGGIYGNMNFILLPQKYMEEKLKENMITKEDFPENLYGMIEKGCGISKQDLVVKEWAPWAYQLIVSDPSIVEDVKKRVSEINPNFLTINEFQDSEAILNSLENISKTVGLVSLSLLFITAFAMALIQAGEMKRKKYEYALLRAGGLTKKEIKKVVLYRMIVGLLALIVVSYVLLPVLYIVLSKFILGIVLNWVAVVLIIIMSGITMILPTVISLLFVNKFEPDQVMRN